MQGSSDKDMKTNTGVIRDAQAINPQQQKQQQQQQQHNNNNNTTTTTITTTTKTIKRSY